MRAMGIAAPPRNRHLILVVDDNCDYADSLCQLLALASGWDTQAAYSVRSALDDAAVRRPDVVLLDLDIPPSSGFEAADALEQALPGRLPVLLAISGNGELLQRAARDARFSQAILKPANPGRLLEWLTGLILEATP